MNRSQMVILTGHSYNGWIQISFLFFYPFQQVGDFFFRKEMSSVSHSFFCMLAVYNWVSHVREYLVCTATELYWENRIMCSLNHIDRGISQIDKKIHKTWGDTPCNWYQAGKPIWVEHSNGVYPDSTVRKSRKKNSIVINIIKGANMID